MVSIKTFVFLHRYGFQREDSTDIMELSFIAVKKSELLAHDNSKSPDVRLLHKLVMYFEKDKSAGSSDSQPEHSYCFNRETFEAINGFIERLEKPVCLLAHNGFRYDFPRLQSLLSRIHVSLPDHVMCTDTLYGSHDIMEHGIWSPSDAISVGPKPYNQLKRDIYFNQTQPEVSYGLRELYARVMGREKIVGYAEIDCLDLLKIVLRIKNEFIDWVDKFHCKFSEVPPSEFW